MCRIYNWQKCELNSTRKYSALAHTIYRPNHRLHFLSKHLIIYSPSQFHHMATIATSVSNNLDLMEAVCGIGWKHQHRIRLIQQMHVKEFRTRRILCRFMAVLAASSKRIMKRKTYSTTVLSSSQATKLLSYSRGWFFQTFAALQLSLCDMDIIKRLL